MSHSTSHSTCESYECLLSRSTLSVRLKGSEHVPNLRALKPGLLLLPLLPGPLAAALHVRHSSPVARCKSARPEEQSRPREAHGNVRCKALGTHPSARTCSPRRLQQPAAPSRQTPPNAARAPREFLPLGRRLALSRGRAVLACDSSSDAPTPGGLASRHEATLAATHPEPLPLQPYLPPRASVAVSLRVMIIDQPEGQRARSDSPSATACALPPRAVFAA